MAPPKPPRRERKAPKPLRRSLLSRGDYQKRERRRVRRTRSREKARTMGLRVATGLRAFKEVMRIADDLWSVWIRARATGCEVCRRPFLPAMLQCAHGWSRTEKATRFEPDNTFAACAHCHRKHTPSGPAWYEWMKGHLGTARYERVKLMALLGGKLRYDDLILLIIDAQQRIEALRSGERKGWALERREAIMLRFQKVAA